MTTADRNPQAKEMADESMVRNLAAQADAIWPQEEPIFSRHSLVMPAAAAILDVGCGTGEITARIGAVYSQAKLTGIDLVEPHLELARRRCTALGDRIEFLSGDAYDLQFPPASFDLVVCRHMLQAVPEPERILAELVRVTRPGGVLHVIAEDYDMIHAAPTRIDVSRFWFEGPRALARATGTDLHIGRSIHAHLRRLGLEDIRVDHVVVDTERVPRPTFAAIFEAWRDGYTETTASHLGWSEDEVRAHFDATIDCIRDPDGYVVWFVPVWTARVRA
jgi:SAM-dependent methyltransferase